LLQWEEPEKSGGCPIEGYVVQADDGDLGAFAAATLPDSATKLPPTQFLFEVTSPDSVSFTLGKMYRFVVVAQNAVGERASNVATAYLADLPAAPAAGPSMVLEETSPAQIRVSFAAFDATDDAATGGSPILSYHIQQTPALGLGQAPQITDTFFDVGGAARNQSLNTAYTVSGL
jgi:hypothetical protein